MNLRHSITTATGTVLALAAMPVMGSTLAAELRLRDQALLDGVARGDRRVWQRALARDAIYIDEDGEVLSRGALIAQLAPLPAGVNGKLKITAYRLILHGDTATVVHRTAENMSYHGQMLNAGYLTSETWQRKGRQWKVTLVHVVAVNRDPPPIPIAQTALAQYAGTYRAGPDLAYVIGFADGQLTGRIADRPPRPLSAELRDVLFEPGRPRSRKIFERDASGAITGFRDRREGGDIVWRKEA